MSSRAVKERELGLIKLVGLLTATMILHWRKYKVVRIQNPFPGRGRVGGRNCLFIHGTFRTGCERCLFLPLLGNPMKNSLQQAPLVGCTPHIPYASMKATAAPTYTPLTYSPYLSTSLLCVSIPCSGCAGSAAPCQAWLFLGCLMGCLGAESAPEQPMGWLPLQHSRGCCSKCPHDPAVSPSKLALQQPSFLVGN